MAEPLSFSADVVHHGRNREVKETIPDPDRETGWIDVEHDVHGFVLQTDPASPIRGHVTVHVPEGAGPQLDYTGRYRVTIEKLDAAG